MMRKYLFILLVLLFSACGSSKKNLEASANKFDSLGYHLAREVRLQRYSDTTVTKTGRVVVTEIDFASTSGGVSNIENLSIDGNSIVASGIRGSPIHTIRQQVYERTSEKKGESKESREEGEQQHAVLVQKGDTKLIKQASPAPDPYRWRYAFYISLVVLICILYLKRVPIVDWIKKMLCGLVKM